MGWFRKEIINPTGSKISTEEKPVIEYKETLYSKGTKPEKPEEDEEDICINCKHHKEEDGDHRCYVYAERTKNYVTGEESWDNVEDCEDVNTVGDCGDFERL